MLWLTTVVRTRAFLPHGRVLRGWPHTCPVTSLGVFTPPRSPPASAPGSYPNKVLDSVGGSPGPGAISPTSTTQLCNLLVVPQFPHL